MEPTVTDPIDTALLPCPFCGGGADVMVPEDDNTPAATVMCMNCYIVGPERGTETEAIAAWNTRAASQADTARAEGIALGLAMAKAAPTYDRNFDTMERVDYGAWISVDDIPEPPIPPHVAAARVLLDAPDTLAAAMVDWARDNQFRLRQIQGFGYGSDGLRFTVRDCWRRNDQVIWQKQSSPETHDADHAEMTRQIDLRCMLLILTAALEQIAKEGE